MLQRARTPLNGTRKGLPGSIAEMARRDIPQRSCAWQIDPARVERGRALYGEICLECHLGPVNDAVLTKISGQEFLDVKRTHWKQDEDGPVLEDVQKSVGGMGTDPAQAQVLAYARSTFPVFSTSILRAISRNSGVANPCPLSSYPLADMPYSLALMDRCRSHHSGNRWMTFT